MTTRTVRKRHPIRALLWGLLVGIGAAIYLTLVFPVIVLDSVSSAVTKMAVVAVGVAIVMTVITMYVIPPKKPKGLPPAPKRTDPPDSAAPEGPPPASTSGDEPQRERPAPPPEAPRESPPHPPAADGGTQEQRDADDSGDPA